jgi:hypothetical protein
VNESDRLGDKFVSRSRRKVARSTKAAGVMSRKKHMRQPQRSLIRPPAAGDAREQITIAMVM